MEKRNTIQKQLVLEAVHRLANHPTAEEVYALVAQTHPSISKATVYRNLAGLSADGQLRHIPMPDGADRFDHNIEAEHYHIICTGCGAFGDAPKADESVLDAAVAAQTGYSGVSHDIVFHGLCPHCAKEGKEAS